MQDQILQIIKNKLSSIDPVAFVEKNLYLEGKPFRINGNGYKPYAEIYRYIGIKALEKDAKPVVVLKSRQTGMTVAASALEMYFMGSGIFGNGINPPIRVIHAFPQLDLAFAYSKVKLTAMINGSVPIEIANEANKKVQTKPIMATLLDLDPSSNSLQFKQFQGGNHLWIESAGADGNRLMGKTGDIIFFDECQKYSPTALSNSIKVLNKAQYGRVGEGVQVYFGTPLQRGSQFWKMWNASSQQYYHLGCAKCKKHFPLYTPGTNDWEDIWLYGFTVRCTHCGFEQDKREAAEHGKWVGNKDLNEADYVGFHINQLYMPEYTKEHLLSQKPENSPINTERAYQNEVLGEFFSGEAAIITPDQVRELCGDPERKFRAEIGLGEETLVFLGIDIGARNDLAQLVDTEQTRSQGQSYSTAVVLAMVGSQRLTIEFATKFKRNDLASKKGIIDQIMRNYNCALGICDYGYANDLNEILQTEYGGRMLASQASMKINNKVKFNDEVFPKVVLFERDFWIAQLYEEMKKGNIRFPMGSYEQVVWLIEHVCSMEIKPMLSKTGDVTPHYVKGTSPNDGFMALLNAYIAYKFYVSQGFQVTHPSLMLDEKPKGIPAILSFLPHMFKNKK